MSRPDWDDAPEWANWVAQDADGEWYWFQLEPRKSCDQWEEGSTNGKISVAYPVHSEWDCTLERRP